jgi:hypothetical protein
MATWARQWSFSRNDTNIEDWHAAVLLVMIVGYMDDAFHGGVVVWEE